MGEVISGHERVNRIRAESGMREMWGEKKTYLGIYTASMEESLAQPTREPVLRARRRISGRNAVIELITQLTPTLLLVLLIQPPFYSAYHFLLQVQH